MRIQFTKPIAIRFLRPMGNERKVFEGVTDRAGISQPVPTRYPEAMTIEFPDTLVPNSEEQ